MRRSLELTDSHQGTVGTTVRERLWSLLGSKEWVPRKELVALTPTRGDVNRLLSAWLVDGFVVKRGTVGVGVDYRRTCDEMPLRRRYKRRRAMSSAPSEEVEIRQESEPGFDIVAALMADVERDRDDEAELVIVSRSGTEYVAVAGEDVRTAQAGSPHSYLTFIAKSICCAGGARRVDNLNEAVVVAGSAIEAYYFRSSQEIPERPARFGPRSEVG